MGKYDDITPDQLRSELLKFARLIRAMEKQEVLLEKAPSLLRILGELRRMIFAYEVRSTAGLVESEHDQREERSGESEAVLDESERIVREALERTRELQDELEDRFFPPDDGDAAS